MTFSADLAAGTLSVDMPEVVLLSPFCAVNSIPSSRYWKPPYIFGQWKQQLSVKCVYKQIYALQFTHDAKRQLFKFAGLCLKRETGSKDLNQAISAEIFRNFLLRKSPSIGFRVANQIWGKIDFEGNIPQNL